MQKVGLELKIVKLIVIITEILTLKLCNIEKKIKVIDSK